MILIPDDLAVIVLIVRPDKVILRTEVIIISVRILQMVHNIINAYSLQLRLCIAVQDQRSLLLLKRQQGPQRILLHSFAGSGFFGLFRFSVFISRGRFCRYFGILRGLTRFCTVFRRCCFCCRGFFCDIRTGAGTVSGINAVCIVPDVVSIADCGTGIARIRRFGFCCRICIFRIFRFRLF